MTHAAVRIKGFVHRDLKPENVLVGADKLSNADINRIRVTDLGLVKIVTEGGEALSLDDEGNPSQIQFTRGAGTPLYMAPEQWRGDPVTAATDVYALGCILYEMLAGQRAVSGHSLAALQRAHCAGQVRPLPKGLPVAVGEIVTRSLAVEPGERYQDWEQVEAALAAAYEDLADRSAPQPEPVAVVSRADQVAAGWSFNAMGISYLDIGKAEVAAGYFERAQEVGSTEGEWWLEGAALGNLGNVYLQLGDDCRAIQFYEQRLEIAREIGDRRGEGNALGNLGIAYKNLGDAHRAIGYYEQALKIDREIGDRRGEGSDLGNLGIAYAALGDARRAIGYHEQCLIIHREIGDRRGEGSDLGNLGSAYGVLGDTKRAIEHHQQALKICREIGDTLTVAMMSANIAMSLARMGRVSEAIPLIEQAVRDFRRAGYPQQAQKAERMLAQIRRDSATLGGPSLAQILQNFAPVIGAVAVAARGHPQARAAVEAAFDQFEQGGWRIVEPVQRIWAGERDEAALTAGLDDADTLIVREILNQLET